MTTEAYVKGPHTRLVSTPSQRVAAEFAGYRPASTQVVDSVDRAALQAQAKALGIKANQSNEALVNAIASFEPKDETVEPDEKSETLGQAPETNDGGSPLDPEND